MLRLTEEQYQEHMARLKKQQQPIPAALLPPQPAPAAPERKARKMNKTEAAYSQVLDARKHIGEISAWHFERITLLLAPDTRYTPDFFVIYPDGRQEFHETKGFWRDDARVKIKVAADLFPFWRFVAITRKKSTWVPEWF